MTKLVKTSNTIASVDDFSKELSKVIDTDSGEQRGEGKRALITTDVSELELRTLAQITIEEAEKLGKEFDEKFPGAKDAFDLIARNGVRLDGVVIKNGVVVEIDNIPLTPQITVSEFLASGLPGADALANLYYGNFKDMRRAITNSWMRVFGVGEGLAAVARSVADKAIERAKELGIPSDAEISVSFCGCVWAQQMAYADSGDVINGCLRTCAIHSPKRKQ